MLLRMPSPVRLNSTVSYLRRRVPADVLLKARGLTLRIPVGDETVPVRVGNSGIVKVSLRTADARIAKERQSKALSYLDQVWTSLRDTTLRLDHQTVYALAGQWYRNAKKRWERDPGGATLWGLLHSRAERWTDEEARAEMMPFVRELLEEHALNIDDDTRERLVVALRRAFKDATALLEGRGRGDYSRDEVEQKYPQWKPEEARGAVSVDLMVNFEDWAREARLANRTEKTIAEYRSLLQRFAAFVGQDDMAQMKPDDFVRWKDQRIADGLSLKTVKDTDMAVFKSIFGWATENRRLSENPVPKLRLKLGKRVHERPKGFVLPEALAILRASSSYAGAARELPQTVLAKRWVPWLCAYTGSRVGEMVQLRREDIARHGTHVVLTITPEAGPVKDKQTRRVVLHPHLVEMGFADIASEAAEGYLFVAASNREEARGRIRAVKNRLCEFVRDIVSDERVSPNHGWRHRFQTIGGEVDASERVVNAICGHGRRDVSDDYGDRTFTAMATALAKYPRYNLDEGLSKDDEGLAARRSIG